jgi:hypothetical protein
LSARADKVAEGEVDPEELLESVSVPGLPDSNSWEGYEGWTAGLVRAVMKVERDLRNMVRERLLPDEKTLEKVARYEAHLSRGLYKALHELEALQVRRAGGAAPLARLDVDGLAEG